VRVCRRTHSPTIITVPSASDSIRVVPLHRKLPPPSATSGHNPRSYRPGRCCVSQPERLTERSQNQEWSGTAMHARRPSPLHPAPQDASW
jgi:hypothetical protein